MPQQGVSIGGPFITLKPHWASQDGIVDVWGFVLKTMQM